MANFDTASKKIAEIAPKDFIESSGRRPHALAWGGMPAPFFS